ncbi:Uma2 family endonuclease [Lewinella sp. 4G2]|uniref:Uma2 family endonuclease n=1 Tax=Lewinella sp. 4G2 TaxID=1803372 RepID=UPI0007B4DEF7|nr:Uma2 family endonuclease [Lewinella sp. 4G2]OAV46157.1 hypothetical protein A3850_018020 [Lewinella sp. 4G2]
MGRPPIAKQHLSIDEWLALEKSTGERYEYHLGEVFAMAGGTRAHSLISGNAFYALEENTRAKGLPCETHASDLKIEVSSKGHYVYPDMLVVCEEVKESDSVAGAITNPQLVIEVTSENSDSYDRGVKFRYYSRLPSVLEYLILDQTQMVATLYRRREKDALFVREDFEGLEATLELRSVELEVQLAVFYRQVEFAVQTEE